MELGFKLAIKKVRIPFSELTPIGSGSDKSYLLKYRVISSDKNRTSEWSPIYNVNPPTVYDPILDSILSSQITVSTSSDSLSDGTLVNLYWDVPVELRDVSEFDVFVRWLDSTGATPMWTDWSFLNTQAQGTISIKKLSSMNYTKLGVSVQLPTYPKDPPIVLDLPASGLFQNNDEIDTKFEVFSIEFSF